MDQTKPSTNGTVDLRQRLNEPETAAALNRLLDRLDTIERTVDALEQLNQQLPDALSTAADTMDDALTRAADRGVVLDERARQALTLTEKLTEPRTVEVLSKLIDRLDQLEPLIELTDQLSGILSTTADVVDESLTRAADRGVVLDERARDALGLLETLTEPRTVTALQRLLEQSDKLEQLADLADQAPDAVAMMVDVADAEYARLQERGYDPELMLRQSFSALGRLGALFQSDEFQALLDSGVLDPQALRVVGTLGDSLVQCQQDCRDDAPQVGFFGLLKAMRDPDVKRALGFLTLFAKHFGQRIRT